jgi:hypothetical protein
MRIGRLRDQHCLAPLGFAGGRLFLHLMHLDDVALRVVEENLVPAVHRPGTVVRIGDAFLVEPLLEGGNIVGAEGDMAALERIDRVLLAESDGEVLLRQVELRRPSCRNETLPA